jgi:hypothetical protein
MPIDTGMRRFRILRHRRGGGFRWRRSRGGRYGGGGRCARGRGCPRGRGCARGRTQVDRRIGDEVYPVHSGRPVIAARREASQGAGTLLEDQAGEVVGIDYLRAGALLFATPPGESSLGSATAGPRARGVGHPERERHCQGGEHRLGLQVQSPHPVEMRSRSAPDIGRRIWSSPLVLIGLKVPARPLPRHPGPRSDTG